jgi:hypothetical protein
VPQQTETLRVPTKAISFFRGSTKPQFASALCAPWKLEPHWEYIQDLTSTVPLEDQDLWTEIAVPLLPPLRDTTQLHALGYAIAYASEEIAEKDWLGQALRYQLFDITGQPPPHLWFAARPVYNEP